MGAAVVELVGLRVAGLVRLAVPQALRAEQALPEEWQLRRALRPPLGREHPPPEGQQPDQRPRLTKPPIRLLRCAKPARPIRPDQATLSQTALRFYMLNRRKVLRRPTRTRKQRPMRSSRRRTDC